MSYQSITNMNQYSRKTCIHLLIAADSVFLKYCNYMSYFASLPLRPLTLLKNLILTLFLILFLLSGKAYAYTLNSQFLTNQIKNSVADQISSIMPGKIVVNVKSIPYRNIDIPPGKLKINVSVNLRYFTPNTIARVSVLVNDKEITAFGVPVRLQVWDKVWVATDTIYRGETLSATNIKVENKEISLNAEKAIKENILLEGNLVRKNFVPGEVIDMRFIESVPTIMKSSQVSLIFKTRLITVNLSGEALANGKMGDYIKVRNKNYKKDYIGKVIGVNTVLINL
ncbi:MAG: flagellar basal body P-ring formation chaperone FlgA [Candidatus Gastranaerophilales bacterium]|nr:flagellar basal body P-ring formation chaperone FlgA [Candidatus Gastranaerophilales bacterium]